jgi:SAM-dependent methyltransferase
MQSVERFERMMLSFAPFMGGTVSKARSTFGEEWVKRFGETLDRIFGDDQQKLELAMQGYVRFALEATKLQKRFQKDRKYAAKTYAEAASEVYHNEYYMMDLYLPGILLSHYLWPHHYRQLQYFHSRFMPLVREAAEKRFYDVGVGTGFYSRQTLGGAPDVQGTAFDISDFSLRYATNQVQAFGLSDRYRLERRNIITEPPREQAPFILSVEVIEHLEDPVAFLRGLRAMLKSGGTAFVTTALTAPNADHIYLYNECQEVVDQLEAAGFVVDEYREEPAYEPRTEGEAVPRIAAFIAH